MDPNLRDPKLQDDPSGSDGETVREGYTGDVVGLDEWQARSDVPRKPYSTEGTEGGGGPEVWVKTG